MPYLQVSELPDSIYKKLFDLANKEHRSISQQAALLLAKSLDIDISPQARRKKILEEIKSQSGELKKYNLINPDKIIREEREK